MFKPTKVRDKRKKILTKDLYKRIRPLIKEAIKKREQCIYVSLTEEEAQILRDDGHKVEHDPVWNNATIYFV